MACSACFLERETERETWGQKCIWDFQNCTSQSDVMACSACSLERETERETWRERQRERPGERDRERDLGTKMYLKISKSHIPIWCYGLFCLFLRERDRERDLERETERETWRERQRERLACSACWPGNLDQHCPLIGWLTFYPVLPDWLIEISFLVSTDFLGHTYLHTYIPTHIYRKIKTNFFLPE